MPLPPRLFPGDEELGKKDDDHKPGAKNPLGIAWQHRQIPHGPHRRNMKRVALGFVVLIALYYFFKNMPKDLEQPRARPNFDHTQSSPSTDARPPPPLNQGTMQKTGTEGTSAASQFYFNGPIKFYQLAATLHAVSKTRGSDRVNQNVVSLLDVLVVLV